MKIDVRRIPPEGLDLEEEIDPAAWELNVDLVRFEHPFKVSARLSRVTNAVTALVKVDTTAIFTCSRCLQEFHCPFKRDFRIDVMVDSAHLLLDFDPEIRDQLILGYPANPLCRFDCRGLCPRCGGDRNSGECGCNK